MVNHGTPTLLPLSTSKKSVTATVTSYYCLFKACLLNKYYVGTTFRCRSCPCR